MDQSEWRVSQPRGNHIDLEITCNAGSLFSLRFRVQRFRMHSSLSPLKSVVWIASRCRNILTHAKTGHFGKFMRQTVPFADVMSGANVRSRVAVGKTFV